MTEEIMESTEPLIDGETENDNEGHNRPVQHNMENFNKRLIENSSEKVFYFESDHAALRGNEDYHLLMKTMAILQVQRIEVMKDVQKLQEMRKKVSNNPREYLRTFLKGDRSDIPSDIKVAEVPNINWSKYNLQSKDEVSFDTISTHKMDTSSLKGVGCSNVNNEYDNMMTKRSERYAQSKPQRWTADEQLKLEELLGQFPPESNENSRWRKIAQALGTRTTKQVCSRVQKYFKKLNQAGLPIPGHQVKSNTMPALKKKQRRHMKGRERDSTFFPTQHLGANQILEYEDQGNKPPVITQELKVEILKRVIECKKKEAELASFYHPDIECVICKERPLQGTRWRCYVCHSVNLCSDCVVSQLNTDRVLHSPLHPLESLTTPNPTTFYCDPDYLPDSFKTTNYLDPNFVVSNGI